MGDRSIVVNAMMTPDGTILHSKHSHDYCSHYDSASNETYVIDGGNDYIRRSINTVAATDLTLYEDDPHDDIRQIFKWGTRGVNGDQPLSWVVLRDMTAEHIVAILETQRLADHIRKLFLNELIWRRNGND